jgi:hypothetical protein
MGIIKEIISEDYKKYLAWKRKNVTYRGIKDIDNPGGHNDNTATLGVGLYTVPLSNKAMAKKYGELYYVYGARPKNPVVFDTINKWEIWMQQNLIFKGSNDITLYDKFFKTKDIRDEMLKLGYDGVIIKGREMVNYTPDENIKYFRYFGDDRSLMDFYERYFENS